MTNKNLLELQLLTLIKLVLKYRFGAYKSTASGKGKLKEGEPYFWMHRVEKLEMASGGESFDPAALE